MTPATPRRRTLALWLLALSCAALGLYAYSVTGWERARAVFLGVNAILFCIGAALLWKGITQRRPVLSMASLGLLLPALALVADASFPISWGGAAVRPITVRVVDDQTGQPTPGASVRVFHPERRMPHWHSEGTTGLDGTVHFDHQFDASGTGSVWKQTGSYRLREQVLGVKAEGYELVEGDLADRIGRWGWGCTGRLCRL